MLTQPPAAARTSRRFATTPASAGLPDPRPLTEYLVEYEEFEGTSRVIVRLDQPCIIRAPRWLFIDVGDGVGIEADGVVVLGNDAIRFEFEGIIAPTVCFIEVPYQDMQVQNFQGGFVRPGGRWFRKPV